jgi:hypothetical protein
VAPQEGRILGQLPDEGVIGRGGIRDDVHRTGALDRV